MLREFAYETVSDENSDKTKSRFQQWQKVDKSIIHSFNDDEEVKYREDVLVLVKQVMGNCDGALG